MSENLEHVRVAAADLESLTFERDAAELSLQESVIAAMSDGASPAAIADASELSVAEVEALTGTIPTVLPAETA